MGHWLAKPWNARERVSKGRFWMVSRQDKKRDPLCSESFGQCYAGPITEFYIQNGGIWRLAGKGGDSRITSSERARYVETCFRQVFDEHMSNEAIILSYKNAGPRLYRVPGKG